MRPVVSKNTFDIDANSKEIPMKHEFSKTAPILRLVFAVAALSVSLSIGGWIDFLASGYAVGADLLHGPVATAERKAE